MTGWIYADANSSDETPLDEFPLTYRTSTRLAKAGYKDAGDVREAPDAELRLISGLGKLSLLEIRETIGPFRLKAEIPPVLLKEALPTLAEIEVLEVRFDRLIEEMQRLLEIIES